VHIASLLTIPEIPVAEPEYMNYNACLMAAL
jgi:hypothetical protein